MNAPGHASGHASGPRGVIIAAPRSGAGKTTITLGLLRALARKGVAVQPFKCGPDYIDPSFHTAAAARASVNLDTWAMRPELITALVLGNATGTNICVAEGVMGLFDGAGALGQCGTGATADLAALTGWPVLLVLDVAAQAETAAAVALGCRAYRSDVTVAGVILNQVGSERHERLIVQAMAHAGLPVLGALRRNHEIALPERHLGLVQAAETINLDERLNRIADAIEHGTDLEGIVGAARPMRIAYDSAPPPLLPPGQRIALAYDRAFSFVYPHVIAGWRRAGAEIVPFSPLADEGPDATCTAVWLPGGYPELNAPQIAGAMGFKWALRAAAARGVPIHGECGGYMVLGCGLEAADGNRYEMAGLLGLESSFARRRLNLGYRRARTGAGGDLFGHEFHYASVLASPDAPLFAVTDVGGAAVEVDCGSRRGSVTGTFFHVIDRAP